MVIRVCQSQAAIEIPFNLVLYNLKYYEAFPGNQLLPGVVVGWCLVETAST